MNPSAKHKGQGKSKSKLAATAAPVASNI